MIFFRVSGVAAVLSQARARSSPRDIRRRLSSFERILTGVGTQQIDLGLEVADGYKPPFHRRSSSSATKRLSGSIASYWRCAREAS